MKLANCEIEAIEKSLPKLGEYVVQSGIVNKPFAECSRDEILALTANIVKIFRVTLAETLGEDAPF